MAKLKVTLIKSLIGNRDSQRRTVHALGLRRINQTIFHEDTPSIRGMVKHVEHLLLVEKLSDGGEG